MSDIAFSYKLKKKESFQELNDTGEMFVML